MLTMPIFLVNTNWVHPDLDLLSKAGKALMRASEIGGEHPMDRATPLPEGTREGFLSVRLVHRAFVLLFSSRQ